MSDLVVTQGTITAVGPGAMMRTTTPTMRATVVDDGRHARSARLRFHYLGKTAATRPLGSGLIRGQIGLKLRAADPCNLLYVMWRAFPRHELSVQVKRNEAQTTSEQCGNDGYTTLATVGLASDPARHDLVVHMRDDPTGGVTLRVLVDDAPLRPIPIPADLAAGLEGPIGVRSDNAAYCFELFHLDRYTGEPGADGADGADGPGLGGRR